MIGIKLDDWQRKFLDTKGDKILCTGRQVGKSMICSMDAGKYVLANSKKYVLMIAPTERQAFELFDKTMSFLADTSPRSIKMGKDRPTKHIIRLKNGSRIYCYPTGKSGLGIRGLTIDRLYVDEASRVPDEVFTAVTPMMLTTGGDTILISTPFGRAGYFFDTWNNTDNTTFTPFSCTSEKVIRARVVGLGWSQFQRDKAIEYLKREKARMSRLEYNQEYMGEFCEEISQFFPDPLINACMLANRPDSIQRNCNYYLGVDIARMGEDQSTFEIVKKVNPKMLVQVENQVTSKTMLTDTTKHIKWLDKQYDFSKILMDDEGIGIGVFDQLMDDEQTNRKTIPINNAKRVQDKDGKNTTTLLKQDLYNHLRAMMERGEIHLLDDPEVFQSLKSVQYAYTTSTKGEPILKIFGNFTHIAEGLIRAAWCTKYKDLNSLFSSFKL